MKKFTITPKARADLKDNRHRLAVFNEFTRQFGQEVERRGLTEEKLMAELEETKHEVFAEQYDRRLKAAKSSLAPLWGTFSN